MEQRHSWTRYLSLSCPMLHDRVNKSPLLVPILSQMKPVHTVLSDYFKMDINVILPSSMTYPFCFFQYSFVPIFRLYALPIK
jgi:hypothetical protein